MCEGGGTCLLKMRDGKLELEVGDGIRELENEG